jgi:hypothetical protein
MGGGYLYAPPKMMWVEGTTRDIAQLRLDEMPADMSAAGMEATGEVGDHHPAPALRDTIDRAGTDMFDGIILSTLPDSISHRLSLGVPPPCRDTLPTLPPPISLQSKRCTTGRDQLGRDMGEPHSISVDVPFEP